MKTVPAISIIAAMLLSAPAPAAESTGLALAKNSGCMACHTVDKKIVGPAYGDVAKKYAGDKRAESRLAAKIRKGGSGAWGPIAMPPNDKVADKDIEMLVKWILAGAK